MKRTPLKRKTPLKSKTPLKRKTPLKPISDKRRKAAGARRTFVREQLSLRPYCEAGLKIGDYCTQHHLNAGSCSKYAVDIHEPLTRARGGSIVDPENSVSLCRICHDWIHNNPKAATELGLLKRAEIR